MLEQKDGWVVVNVRDASWYASEAFGKVCLFEDPKHPFPRRESGSSCSSRASPTAATTGSPPRRICSCSREGAVCWSTARRGSSSPGTTSTSPPGVSHIVGGEGEEPCAVLMIGHRPGNHELFYPESELAHRYGAEAPEPTENPRVEQARLQKNSSHSVAVKSENHDADQPTRTASPAMQKRKADGARMISKVLQRGHRAEPRRQRPVAFRQWGALREMEAPTIRLVARRHP